jgi:CO/xanthine dehydrogenase Mo-binding subunit
VVESNVESIRMFTTRPMAHYAGERRPALIYLGQSLRRFEDLRLLTGQSQFVDDIMLPGMLHAVVLRSPHAHATITSMEVAAARRATGVVSVVTASDLEHVTAHLPTRRNADADELRPPEHPVHGRGHTVDVEATAQSVSCQPWRHRPPSPMRSWMRYLPGASAISIRP